MSGMGFCMASGTLYLKMFSPIFPHLGMGRRRAWITRTVGIRPTKVDRAFGTCAPFYSNHGVEIYPPASSGVWGVQSFYFCLYVRGFHGGEKEGGHNNSRTGSSIQVAKFAAHYTKSTFTTAMSHTTHSKASGFGGDSFP